MFNIEEKTIIQVVLFKTNNKYNLVNPQLIVISNRLVHLWASPGGTLTQDRKYKLTMYCIIKLS